MKFYFKALTVLLLIVFFVFQAAGLRREYDRSRVTAHNSLSPQAFDDLVLMVDRQLPLNAKKIRAYLRYFKEVARLSPQRADAVGMQGFCFYYLADYDQAMNAYVRASQIVPEFFGFHYNLAAVYYRKGLYPQAAEELVKALSLNPQISLAYILSSSQIYGMIMLAQGRLLDKSVEQQFQENYRKAYQLMAATQFHLQKKEAYPDEGQLSLELF